MAGGLRSAIAALVPTGVLALIVVDQFEELFTLTQERDTRIAFIDQLLAAAQTSSSHPLYVVVTLRADYYGHCWPPGLPLAERWTAFHEGVAIATLTTRTQQPAS